MPFRERHPIRTLQNAKVHGIAAVPSHHHHNQELIESAGLHGLRFLMPNHEKILKEPLALHSRNFSRE